jgi:hypothetical protein
MCIKTTQIFTSLLSVYNTRKDKIIIIEGPHCNWTFWVLFLYARNNRLMKQFLFQINDHSLIKTWRCSSVELVAWILEKTGWNIKVGWHIFESKWILKPTFLTIICRFDNYCVSLGTYLQNEMGEKRKRSVHRNLNYPGNNSIVSWINLANI